MEPQAKLGNLVLIHNNIYTLPLSQIEVHAGYPTVPDYRVSGIRQENTDLEKSLKAKALPLIKDAAGVLHGSSSEKKRSDNIYLMQVQVLSPLPQLQTVAGAT